MEWRMRKYTKTDVSEQELEDLVRRHAELIEEGLVYVDHQKPAAGGRLDVLLVDSGKSLVVAELKVTQDDGMLLQGLDYYDYVSTHVETFARLYKTHAIDPTQQVRLLLVAPSFSQALVNRCKWLDLPISLFTFACLRFEGESDVLPVFTEREKTAPPEVVEVAHLDDHLNYITDLAVRTQVSTLLQDVRNWRPGSVSTDPIKYGVSMKVNGRVFACLYPRRQHYIVSTYDASDEWKDFPVKTEDDLSLVTVTTKAAMERRAKSS
jgi:hypothetical protein